MDGSFKGAGWKACGLPSFKQFYKKYFPADIVIEQRFRHNTHIHLTAFLTTNAVQVKNQYKKKLVID